MTKTEAGEDLRRMRWIMGHVRHLSPAGRRWLLARLSAVECADDTTRPSVQEDS